MVKNPPADEGDIRGVGSIPGLGRSPGGGHGNPLHFSCLENPMDRGAWWTTVNRVTKSRSNLAHTHTGIFRHLVQPPFGEGNGNPLQYSCLGNSKNRGAWQAMVHRVAESQTPLR